MRTLGRLLLVALLALPARPAGSEPSTGGRCRDGAESALGGIACDLRKTLGGSVTAPVVVGIAPVGTTPLQPALAVSVAVRLALELGAGAHAWPIAEQSEHARALARGSRPMLLVTPSLEGDRLAVSVEALGPKTNASPTASETLSRASARRWLDAEVRRFMPAVTIPTKALKRAGNLDADVVALTCGGANDFPAVASVGRQAVSIALLRGDVLDAPLVRVPLKELAEVAPVPLREPLASAWFTPAGELLLGSTDRAQGARLGPEPGARFRALDARLPWPGGGCARLDGLLLAPSAVSCAKGEPAPPTPKLTEPLDALAGVTLVSRSGTTRLVRAGRRGSDAAVMISDGLREARLERAGAALALGDMDGDGTPELVTSLDTADPGADAVVVYSWLAAGLAERWRVPITAGVKALAICPQRAAALAPVAVASGGALWLLQ
jgi:hypothetical protein